MPAKRGPQPVLHGSKVLLRPWTPHDAESVFTACQDPDIQRWVPVPSPYALSDAVEYVTETAPAAWANGGAVFAVVELTTDQMSGAIGVQRLNDGVAHVGYWTRREARGKGLTAEALRMITTWFLHEGQAARVELVVEPDNSASIRVAEAAGFTREGVLRQRLNLRGRRADVVMYSMLRTDPATGGS
jgi:RimJ/RimL family protein N-acetyltransferase